MKRVVVLLLVLMVTSNCNGQDIEKVFDIDQPVTWLGIDFSRAHFVNDYYKFLSVERTSKFMEALNRVVANEPRKYDLALMAHKWPRSVKYQEDVTIDHNASLNIENILADSTSQLHLNPDSIAAIVRSYDFKNHRGMGLMLIIDEFNKNKPDTGEPEALVWVTFINMDSKSVILTNSVIGIAGGGGLRNYWLGAIYDIMKHVGNKEFKQWRKSHKKSKIR